MCVSVDKTGTTDAFKSNTKYAPDKKTIAGFSNTYVNVYVPMYVWLCMYCPTPNNRTDMTGNLKSGVVDDHIAFVYLYLSDIPNLFIGSSSADVIQQLCPECRDLYRYFTYTNTPG